MADLAHRSNQVTSPRSKPTSDSGREGSASAHVAQPPRHEAAQSLVHGLGAAEVRQQIGSDANQIARPQVRAVSAARHALEPPLVRELGHFREGLCGRLRARFRRGVAHEGWRAAR
jgi:hypothetical protein